MSMRRRLRVPILVAGATCPGTHRQGQRSVVIPLDDFGDHLNSCTRTGRPQRRALPFERAWIQVFREAGLNVQPKPLVRNLGLIPAPPASDGRQLDFVATGSDLCGGLPLGCDPTLRSVLDCKGVPHEYDAFEQARKDKNEAYRDVRESGRISLVVLAALTGGRFSDESAQVLRSLVRQKCAAAPPLMRGSLRQAFSQRWWQILSCAVQRASVACLQESFPPVAGPWEFPDDFAVAEEATEVPVFSRLGP